MFCGRREGAFVSGGTTSSSLKMFRSFQVRASESSPTAPKQIVQRHRAVLHQDEQVGAAKGESVHSNYFGMSQLRENSDLPNGRLHASRRAYSSLLCCSVVRSETIVLPARDENFFHRNVRIRVTREIHAPGSAPTDFLADDHVRPIDDKL